MQTHCQLLNQNRNIYLICSTAVGSAQFYCVTLHYEDFVFEFELARLMIAR